MAIDNPEKAKQLLDSINYFPDNKIGFCYKAIYYNNLCAYYLQVNEIPDAEIMLENMLSALQNEKYPKQLYDLTYNAYTEKQYSINLAKGNYSGAEEVVSIQYNREKSKLGKVVAKYKLGKIYIHFERFDEAKEAFQYVIDSGNKTYYVGKSIELLSQCRAEAST